MKVKNIILSALVLLGFTSFNSVANANCGKVTIAEMNWASAQVIAHIDNIILGKGYGCDSELIPGDTMPTATSLTEKGEPSIAPELWSQNIKNILDPAEAAGKIKNVGKVFENGGEEGFFVPTYMVKKNSELATIEILFKPATASISGVTERLKYSVSSISIANVDGWAIISQLSIPLPLNERVTPSWVLPPVFLTATWNFTFSFGSTVFSPIDGVRVFPYIELTSQFAAAVLVLPPLSEFCDLDLKLTCPNSPPSAVLVVLFAILTYKVAVPVSSSSTESSVGITKTVYPVGIVELMIDIS